MQHSTEYPSDILVYVIVSLIGFNGMLIALVVWIVKNELDKIRKNIHDLRDTIQRLIMEVVKGARYGNTSNK